MTEVQKKPQTVCKVQEIAMAFDRPSERKVDTLSLEATAKFISKAKVSV